MSEEQAARNRVRCADTVFERGKEGTPRQTTRNFPTLTYDPAVAEAACQQGQQPGDPDDDEGDDVKVASHAPRDHGHILGALAVRPDITAEVTRREAVREDAARVPLIEAGIGRIAPVVL